MGNFHYDKKGYPRWNDTNELVHRSVSKPKDDEVYEGEFEWMEKIIKKGNKKQRKARKKTKTDKNSVLEVKK